MAQGQLQRHQRRGLREVSTREVVGHRLVRDSKHPDDAVLAIMPPEWLAFITSAKAGDFDLS